MTHDQQNPGRTTRWRDVVVRYDADSRRLKVYPGRGVAGTQISSLHEIEPIELVCGSETGSDGLARQIGEAVLACLKQNADSAGSEEAVGSGWSLPQLEEAAANHDPRAQYQLALYLRERAFSERSLFSLNRAEMLLVAAANHGYPAARKLLVDWPAIRTAVHWQIERDHA